jgi:hypothetical protein
VRDRREDIVEQVETVCDQVYRRLDRIVNEALDVVPRRSDRPEEVVPPGDRIPPLRQKG